MEYDSLRQRPTGRASHTALAVLALASSLASIVANGCSFLPATKLHDIGLGRTPLWHSDNGSEVPAEEWVRYVALGLVYPWQLLWIGYCIVQLAFGVSNVSVPGKVLAVHALASLLDVALVYATAWGRTNKTCPLPLGFSLLVVVTLYSAVAMEGFHLYTLAPDINAFSLRLAWTLVLNGLVAYATWATLDVLLDLDDVILCYSDGRGAISGTLVLGLAFFFVVVYFVLETTILDRFLRGVFVVYPIVIWTVGGVHTMQLQRGGVNPRNEDMSLVLLIGVCGLFVIRILLLVIFSIFRPLPRYKPDYVLK